MRFSIGDENDNALCRALSHEFLRCHDAYLDFAQLSGLLCREAGDRQVSYRAYNAYTRFLFHLYEFMMGEEQAIG